METQTITTNGRAPDAVRNLLVKESGIINQTHIAEGLVITSGVEVYAPALKTVGRIVLWDGARLIAPALVETHASVDMEEDSSLFAPKLEHGQARRESNTKLNVGGDHLRRQDDFNALYWEWSKL